MEQDFSRWHINKRATSWRPPMDIYETRDSITVRIEVAGMQEDDFIIELNGRFLSIRGARPDIVEHRAFHQMEIRFGEFYLEFEIPIPVDVEKIEAIYNNGFLLVSLPKSTPQQIEIG